MLKRSQDVEHDEPNDDTYDDLVDEEDQRQEEDEVRDNEEHTLLPKRLARAATHKRHQGLRYGRRLWRRAPKFLQETLSFVASFTNAPLIGALIGIIIGFAPPLKRAFFNQAEDGGFFNAWLTTCVRNIGGLFPTLQVIVVGVKLRQSLHQMKKGESGGALPWLPSLYVLLVRFVVWPAISIPLLWALAQKAHLLAPDPFLVFAMAIMPAGPPALKLAALADVNGSPEEEQMSIARFLTFAYAVSPIMAFAVVGALKASQAAVV